MLKYMTIADAVKAVKGHWVGNENRLNTRISEVITDSRKASDGVLFIAIPGEKVDGHDFISQVIESGAAGAVSERELEGVENYILVENTRTALRDLAAYYRSILDIKVVGITGSVGKTSTKEMISAVLSEKFRVQKTAGNFNNEIGVPLTVFSITEEHEIAVTEMGISDFGEMTRLAMITRPDIMVITNIGQCHLENLGTRDGIFKAKTECFEYLSDGARVVLNGNDDKLINVKEVQGRKPFFFGVRGAEGGSLPNQAESGKNIAGSPKTENAEGLYVSASDIETLGLEGSDAVINIGGVQKKIHIPVAGAHMVINACAAAAVGTILGMTMDEIEAGIGKCQAVAGRGRLIQTDSYLLVDDTYNANPVSMKAELDLLSESKGRRVAILGDMFELGTDEKKLHADVGAYAKDRCDLLICIGELSKNTYDAAVDASSPKICDNDRQKNIFYFTDKESFLEKKDDILKNGDTILLKASHGMAFGELLDRLQEQAD